MSEANEPADMENKEVAVAKPEAKQIVVHDDGEFAVLLDTGRFNQTWRVARLFAASKLVPIHFQGQTESVFVMLQMAFRLKVDPFMVLQNTYMVHGRPGLEAKLLIALVNARGPFTGPIQWRLEGEGANRQCTAYATHKVTGEVCEATVTWKMVTDEGWNKDAKARDGSIIKSKWNTMADLMFRYRSAAFLARLHCPEAILGLNTADELNDIQTNGFDLEPTAPAPSVATAFPEVEVSPETIQQFNQLVDDQKPSPQDWELLDQFLGTTAQHYGVTPDRLKTGAVEDFDGFWQSFLAWAGDKRGQQGEPPEQSANETQGEKNTGQENTNDPEPKNRQKSGELQGLF